MKPHTNFVRLLFFALFTSFHLHGSLAEILSVFIPIAHARHKRHQDTNQQVQQKDNSDKDANHTDHFYTLLHEVISHGTFIKDIYLYGQYWREYAYNGKQYFFSSTGEIHQSWGDPVSIESIAKGSHNNSPQQATSNSNHLFDMPFNIPSQIGTYAQCAQKQQRVRIKHSELKTIEKQWQDTKKECEKVLNNEFTRFKQNYSQVTKYDAYEISRFYQTTINHAKQRISELENDKDSNKLAIEYESMRLNNAQAHLTFINKQFFSEAQEHELASMQIYLKHKLEQGEPLSTREHLILQSLDLTLQEQGALHEYQPFISDETKELLLEQGITETYEHFYANATEGLLFLENIERLNNVAALKKAIPQSDMVVNEHARAITSFTAASIEELEQHHVSKSIGWSDFCQSLYENVSNYAYTTYRIGAAFAKGTIQGVAAGSAFEIGRGLVFAGATLLGGTPLKIAYAADKLFSLYCTGDLILNAQESITKFMKLSAEEKAEQIGTVFGTMLIATPDFKLNKRLTKHVKKGQDALNKIGKAECTAISETGMVQYCGMEQYRGKAYPKQLVEQFLAAEQKKTGKVLSCADIQRETHYFEHAHLAQRSPLAAGIIESTSHWCMSEEPCIIYGRTYTSHALERMAPNTQEIRAALHTRRIKKGLTPKDSKYHSYIQPRGIPPMVVEHVIRNGKTAPATEPFTWCHIKDGIKVFTDIEGKVKSVHKI